MTKNNLFITFSGISRRATSVLLGVRIEGSHGRSFGKEIICRLLSTGTRGINRTARGLSIKGRGTTIITGGVEVSSPRL